MKPLLAPPCLVRLLIVNSGAVRIGRNRYSRGCGRGKFRLVRKQGVMPEAARRDGLETIVGFEIQGACGMALQVVI